MDLIKIYILAWNRPGHILASIDSALNQTYHNIQVIVSDNSTNEDVWNLLVGRYEEEPRYKYVRRNPSFPTGIAHMNQILEEVDSDYFMMFHDDDVMHSDMVERMYTEMKKREDIVAVGTNADVIKYEKKLNRLFINIDKNELVLTHIDMLKKYLKGGIAPFPSYMYRRSKVGNLRLDFSKGHKWCDAAFIISLSQQAPILILSNSLMDWHIHKGQDSLIHDFMGNLKLIKFYSSLDSNNSMLKYINRFRVLNICHELKEKDRLKLFSPYFFLFLKYSPTYLFPRYIYYLLKKYEKNLSIVSSKFTFR